MICLTCGKDLSNDIKYVDKWNSLIKGWEVYLCKEHYFMDLEYRHAFTKEIPKLYAELLKQWQK